MKKSTLCSAFLLLACTAFSQSYEFQIVKDIETLPVISQDETGTCWSFATNSFLEAEIFRQTGKIIDLSEMYNVRNTFLEKAENYVMRQGKAQFSEGGLSHDVINSARKYGLVPQSAYTGKVNPAFSYNDKKMNAELQAIVKKAVAETPKKYLNWKADFVAVLDTYLGKYDDKTTFSKPLTDGNTVNSEILNPKQFLASTQLNLDDFVTLTSFTNEPFYSKFILSIPDNFANGYFYNLPLDEFIQNIDNAIDNGFTLTLDADVSENTFSKEEGIAVIPENENDSKSILKELRPEKAITQEYRQSEFENYNTQDDHLIHIVGKAKDQRGNTYYKIKNSWGTKSGKDGYFYFSVAYLRLKAISVMLHKDGLLKKTRTTLQL